MFLHSNWHNKPCFAIINLSNTDTVTDMGLASGSIPLNLLVTVQSMIPETDRSQWHGDVRNLAGNSMVCAEGGDNPANGVPTCLGLKIYRSLDFSQKKQVNEALYVV